MDCLEITIEYHSTVLDVRHLTEGETFWVGADVEAGFPVPETVFGARWGLARVREGVPRLRIPAGTGLATFIGGEPRWLAPLSTSRGVTLPPEGRARLSLGAITLYFARVRQPRALARRGVGALWSTDWPSLGLAAGLHALLLLIAWATPVDASESPRLVPSSDRVCLLGPPKPAPAVAPPSLAPLQTEPLTDPPRAAGPRRIAHTPHRPRRPKVAPAARAKAAAGAARRRLDAILGDALAEPALGRAAVTAMRGMNGSTDGLRRGLAAPPGVGPGGPGVAGPGPSVGIGVLDRRGFRHVGEGPARSRLGRRGSKRPPEPRVVPQAPELEGALSRAEIRRVIRRHRAEYRYCYEKALNANRTLNGKVVVKFMIGPTGAVTAARVVESTLADPVVGRCVAQRIQRWAFPAPRDRGVVVVRYPFLFKPSGG